MAYCSVRLLCYLSASFELVCCIILLFLLAIAGIVANHEFFQQSTEGMIIAETTKITVIVLSVLCLVAIALLITVLVGIHQKRLTLISIYVYSSYVFIVLGFLAAIAKMVMDINNYETFRDILINVLINLLLIGLDILLLVPILILHRRMREPPLLPTTYGGAAGTSPKEY